MIYIPAFSIWFVSEADKWSRVVYKNTCYAGLSTLLRLEIIMWLLTCFAHIAAETVSGPCMSCVFIESV